VPFCGSLPFPKDVAEGDPAGRHSRIVPTEEAPGAGAEIAGLFRLAPRPAQETSRLFGLAPERPRA
jgi:hypothetical protein